MVRTTCSNPVCRRTFDADERQSAKGTAVCPICGSRQSGSVAPSKLTLRDLLERRPSSATVGQLINSCCQSCHAYFRVRADRIGQRATCPKCGANVLVGRAASAGGSTKPAEATTIRFQCPCCGRWITARQEYVGRREECPHCKNLVLVARPSPVLTPDDHVWLVDEENARREAEEKARREAEERARRKAEEQARTAAKQQARRETTAEAVAEARARAEAKSQAENRVRQAAEMRSRREEAIRTAKRKLEASATDVEEAMRAWVEDAETESALISPGSNADVGPAVMSRNRLSTPLHELLSRPLGHGLLGRKVSAGVYGTNVFRLLAVSANLSNQDLLNVITEFADLSERAPRAAARSTIRLGYDRHVCVKKIDWLILDATSAPARLLCELFWLHLPPDEFREVKRMGTIIAPAVLDRWTRLAESDNSTKAVLFKHALAVGHHNRALAGEFAYSSGRPGAPGADWLTALALWREVLDSNAFWSYMQDRAAGIPIEGEPAALINDLRTQLPSVLVGINALLGRTYARAGNPVDCHRHLSYISRSGLAPTVCERVMNAAIRAAYW